MQVQRDAKGEPLALDDEGCATLRTTIMKGIRMAKPTRDPYLDSIATHIALAMKLPAGASVLDRIIKAIDIKAHNDIKTYPQEDGWTLATVASQSEKAKTYTLQMSAEQSVCLCSCPDWNKAHKPDAGGSTRIASFHCKHIIAVKLHTNPRLLSRLFPQPKPVRRESEAIQILANGYIIEGD